ncbi:hypothetical protein M5X00_12690 [Paenibacillus alvei]|uniref:hypothetical protein n=2 Tax=Paenibacillus TaxID=44249 RepID=UPI0022812F30|nr:hypothetical protein [Paenibacillus alvei]MCY9755097.1 hypothetical protein [Paenibacillus alvei]
MYADRLDTEFHRRTIEELLRVAKEEVRIFPLIDLEGKRSSQVDEVIHLVQNRGCDVQEKEVPYEFMRGGLDRIKAAFFYLRKLQNLQIQKNTHDSR